MEPPDRVSTYNSVQPTFISWHEDAACRDADPELFAPVDGEHQKVQARRAQSVAIRYCLTCPVRLQCADEGDSNQLVGLFGGSWRWWVGPPRTYRVRDLLDRPWMAPYLGRVA